MHIVAMFPADNYIVAQAANKVLLSWRYQVTGFGPPPSVSQVLARGISRQRRWDPTPGQPVWREFPVRRAVPGRRGRAAKPGAAFLHVRARKPAAGASQALEQEGRELRAGLAELLV